MATDPHRTLARVIVALDAADAGPTQEDLRDAPILDLWGVMVTLDGLPLLAGEVTGHPLLGSTAITTSRLLALEPDQGWARTFSRWYRLGISLNTLVEDVQRRLDGGKTDPAPIRIGLPGHLPLDDGETLTAMMRAYASQMRAIHAALGAR